MRGRWCIRYQQQRCSGYAGGGDLFSFSTYWENNLSQVGPRPRQSHFRLRNFGIPMGSPIGIVQETNRFRHRGRVRAHLRVPTGLSAAQQFLQLLLTHIGPVRSESKKFPQTISKCGWFWSESTAVRKPGAEQKHRACVGG